MQYDIRADIKEAEKYLVGLRKDQIPFAAAYALTQTAKDAQSDIVSAMKTVFNNPKPFTLQGTFVIPATKSKLYATVKLKDGSLRESLETSKRGTADKYLAASVKGGNRKNTAFERALIYNGLMPPGYFAIPTRLAPKDQYGNVPPGVYTRIMSQLQIGDEFQRKASKPKAKASARPVNRLKGSSPVERQKKFERAQQRKKQQALQNVTRPKRPRGYPIFNVYPKREKNRHLAPGIYERVTTGFGSTIRPLFIYTDKAPTYKPRLQFFKIATDSAKQNFGSNFNKGFKIAQATARGSIAEQTDALLRAGISDYMGGTIR